MQYIADSLLAYFVTPFWSVPVGLLICAIVGLFCLAAFWWEPTGGEFFKREGIRPTSSRVGNAALALAVPIAIAVGVWLIVFPAQAPVGVYLKSQSYPAVFDPDIASDWDADLSDWLRHLEAVGMNAVDASAYVDDVLQGLLERTPQNGWRRDAADTSSTVAELVVESLGKKPVDLSRGSLWHERQPRWLIESVEIAVLKGLLLERNVQAMTVEAHPRRTPSGHAWVGITRYLAADLGTFGWVLDEEPARIFGEDLIVPASYIKDDASQLGSEEIPHIVGRPRYYIATDNVTIAFKMAWPTGFSEATVTAVVDGVRQAPVTLSQNVVVPTDTIEQLGTTPGAAGIAALELVVSSGGSTVTVPGVQFSFPQTIEVSVDGPGAPAVIETVRQLQTCATAELANWRAVMRDHISVGSVRLTTGPADVEISLEGDEGIWFKPQGITDDRLGELRSRLKPIPVAELGDQQFMKVSRSRLVPPGPYSLHNTPFVYDEAQRYFATDSGDERAFIVDHDPRAVFNSGPVRIHTVRPLIVQWRVPRENESGFTNLVHMALDPDIQGLLLRPDCTPNNAAAFDNGRFFPVWRAFFEAIESAAVSQLSADSVEARERLSEPLFALDDTAQTRLRAERTRPGLVLVLLGILLLLYTATRGVAAARRVTRDE
ncbi:MAG: hypothetical protein ACFHX7_12375 [Pseudomonadota bacterium]